jgi:spore germination protein
LKIHIVKPGESPWTISQLYGINVNSLIEVNGLNQLPHLLVGQSLVIPGVDALHTVRPGESLWSISQRYGVTVDSIAELNNIINAAQITPGMKIRIPQKAKRYGVIESNGFIVPSNPQRENIVINEAGPYLTYISPFSYEVTENITLKPIEDENIIATARKFRTAALMSVTNISAGGFNTELIDRILTNDQLSQTLINNIIAILRQKGYYGVVVDFERISPRNRQAYNNFLRRLKSALGVNYVLATALAPKTSDTFEGAWHGAHDYRAHGEIADFVIIMTYEWGWSGGPPMAVAPINEVRNVINYALSVMPANKIMMGIPLYGYDWTLPYEPRGEFAKAIGYLEALEIAANNNASIRYDVRSASPNFMYYDTNGREHIVWFEDVRSLFEKYKMVNQYGLRGVSYWALGKTAPMNWYLLDSMFKITKVI